MRLATQSQGRAGATLLEHAIVLPITFFLLLMMVVGSMGVLRYQETASLARSAARYASTHGAQYRRDAGLVTGSPGTYIEKSDGMHWYSANPLAMSGSDTAWAQDICDQAIGTNRVALAPANMTIKIGWPAVVNQLDKPDNWPNSRVTVTVSYQWTPEFYLIGPITLTSTSTMNITN